MSAELRVRIDGRDRNSFPSGARGSIVHYLHQKSPNMIEPFRIYSGYLHPYRCVAERWDVLGIYSADAAIALERPEELRVTRNVDLRARSPAVNSLDDR